MNEKCDEREHMQFYPFEKSTECAIQIDHHNLNQ